MSIIAPRRGGPGGRGASVDIPGWAQRRVPPRPLLGARVAGPGRGRWWCWWLRLNRWLELGLRDPLPRGATGAARRRAAAQYEAAAPQIAARFRRLVASLDRLLREEVR